MGWNVQVWSWREAMHGVWKRLLPHYSKLEIKFLNPHLHSVVSFEQLVEYNYHQVSRRVETEEDRMLKVMHVHAEYANSIIGRCRECHTCGKHHRTPLHQLCQCRMLR